MGEVIRVRGRVESDPRLRTFFPSTLREIRDNGIALYKRATAEEYKECPGDILAVSRMADDIRDAVLDYQASGGKSSVAAVPLNWDVPTDGPATGNI